MSILSLLAVQSDGHTFLLLGRCVGSRPVSCPLKASLPFLHVFFLGRVLCDSIFVVSLVVTQTGTSVQT